MTVDVERMTMGSPAIAWVRDGDRAVVYADLRATDAQVEFAVMAARLGIDLTPAELVPEPRSSIEPQPEGARTY